VLDSLHHVQSVKADKHIGYVILLNHIIDALFCLYWPRMLERVWYNISILVYKVLHGLTPQYLGSLNYIVADLTGCQPLCVPLVKFHH